jgi:UPF0716 family protein affecting phage T7 exclusion
MPRADASSARACATSARHVFLVDLVIAVVAAILVLALTPGLAVAAMIAILVLIACVISVTREARRDRARIARRNRITARRR